MNKQGLSLAYTEDFNKLKHAGPTQFRFFSGNRHEIPSEWRSVGRTLLFFGDIKNSENGMLYIPALVYIKGLIYCSFADPSGWETKLVRIGDDGMPVMTLGKEDLSMYYRYVVQN
jgi:hypothetical protein